MGKIQEERTLKEKTYKKLHLLVSSPYYFKIIKGWKGCLMWTQGKEANTREKDFMEPYLEKINKNNF